MKSFLSHSEKQTEDIAREFAKTLKNHDVIAFLGDLGAGKTAFVRGLAKGLCIEDDVSSPTFAIVNEYSGTLPLFHFDMYRINTLGELYSIGFFDYLDRDGICAIEWSENISSALPDNAIYVEITPQGENERQIKIYTEEEK